MQSINKNNFFKYEILYFLCFRNANVLLYLFVIIFHCHISFTYIDVCFNKNHTCKARGRYVLEAYLTKFNLIDEKFLHSTINLKAGEHFKLVLKRVLGFGRYESNTSTWFYGNIFWNLVDVLFKTEICYIQ